MAIIRFEYQKKPDGVSEADYLEETVSKFYTELHNAGIWIEVELKYPNINISGADAYGDSKKAVVDFSKPNRVTLKVPGIPVPDLNPVGMPYINLLTGGLIYFVHSQDYLALFTEFNHGFNSYGPMIVGERQRVDPWDTPGGAYSTAVYGIAYNLFNVLVSSLSTSSEGYFGFRSASVRLDPNVSGNRVLLKDGSTESSRVYAPTDSYFVSTLAGVHFPSPAAVNYPSWSGILPGLSPKDQTFDYVFPLQLTASPAIGYFHSGGRLRGDIYLTTSKKGKTGDTVMYNGKKYFLFADGTSGARLMLG
jgi:hypothetical protein